MRAATLVLVFFVTFGVSFGVLAGGTWWFRDTLRKRRRVALEHFLRARATVYTQMNALLGEFQRLSRLDRRERVKAVSPDPATSSTGLLLADVAERLAIVQTDTDPARAPSQLKSLATALDQVVQASLDGIRAALLSRDPEAFINSLPKASPTVHAQALRRLDAELKPVAKEEGLDDDESLYENARFYV